MYILIFFGLYVIVIRNEIEIYYYNYTSTNLICGYYILYSLYFKSII